MEAVMVDMEGVIVQTLPAMPMFSNNRLKLEHKPSNAVSNIFETSTANQQESRRHLRHEKLRACSVTGVKPLRKCTRMCVKQLNVLRNKLPTTLRKSTGRK